MLPQFKHLYRTTFTLRLAFLLLLLTGSLLFSGCGDDDDDDPTTPDNTIEKTVAVPGNTQWLNTELTVEAGDEAAITASGTVVYDLNNNTCGPAGAPWTDAADQLDPLWEQPHAGLIGKLDAAGTPFFIGDALTFSPQTGGTLFLGINDYWYQQNSGEFSVHIKITKAT